MSSGIAGSIIDNSTETTTAGAGAGARSSGSIARVDNGTARIASASRTMEFYRSSAAGIALTKALNTMLEEGDIGMEEAVQVLEEFDSCFVNSMRETYATHKRLELMEVNGELFSYNNLSAFWKIDARTVSLTIGGEEIKFDKARFLFMTD